MENEQEMEMETERVIQNVFDECYLIIKGLRSCALLDIINIDRFDIKEGILSEIQQAALQDNLSVVWFDISKREGISEGYREPNKFYSVWIYKYNHQLPIIQAIETDPNITDFFREWVTGKVLGYSDEAMEEYLTKHVYKSAFDNPDGITHVSSKGDGQNDGK